MSPLWRHRHGHILALLVVLFAAASDGNQAGDTYNCQPEPSTCGHLSVEYPFHLYDGTYDALKEYSAPRSYCGYPGLTILCDDGKPSLCLGRGNYTVSAINYTNLTVSLADVDVAGGNGSCPRVRHNVTVPKPFHLATSTDAYLFFFIDCSFAPDGDFGPRPLHKPSSLKPITCASSEADPATMSFVLPEREVPPNDWWRACQSVYSTPVLREAIPADAQDAGWRGGGYAKALRGGFHVSWDLSSGRCGRCEHSSGKCGYNSTGVFLGCLCTNGALVGSDGCSDISGSIAPLLGQGIRKTRTYAIAGSSSILFICLLLFAIWLGCKKYGCKRKSKGTTRIESFLQKNGTIHPKRYTYSQVKRMTRSFAEKLGQGGFGAVYRGSFSDGRQIAVKMLKDYKTDGEDFINEVASISRTSHVNVVTLIGFCLEGSKRALIYDYMPNGSLEKYAFKDNSEGGNTLGWEKMFDIAVGIARGLEYLHRGCNTRIVHFDIKPHNILLDQNFCPKISDFGLAKLCLNQESAISIGGARGTIGYIAPEVYSKQFGAVSSKSDVYSYGMMLLEMAGAKDKNINQNSESSSQYFPQWIYEHVDEYCVSASEINGEITEIVRKMIVVGLWCIQLSAANRPTMTRVVEMLEGSTSVLELPPKSLWS